MMMQEDWVVDAVAAIKTSPVWDLVSEEVYVRLNAIVNSQRLTRLADLDDKELMALLESVHMDMATEEDDCQVYKAFEWQFGRAMDEALSKEARKRLDRGAADAVSAGAGRNAVISHGSKRKTYQGAHLEHIQRLAADGTLSLLQQLPPEHHTALRLAVGHELPLTLRADIWRLALRHTRARTDYDLNASRGKGAIISAQDAAITEKCQALVQDGGVRDSHILPFSSHVVIMMKMVLSYHRACCMDTFEYKKDNKQVEVPNIYYYWVIPLVRVLGGVDNLCVSSSTKRPPSAGKNASTFLPALVEAFEALLDSRNGPQQLTSSHRQQWAAVIHDMLLPSHKALLRHIQSISSKDNANVSDKLNADEVKTALAEFLEDIVSTALVGCVSSEVCIFAWDQALMAGFNVMIPRIAAMLMIALIDPLLACSTPDNFANVLKIQSMNIELEALQMLMEDYCLPALRTDLKLGKGLSTTITGPTYTDATAIFEKVFQGNNKQPASLLRNRTAKGGLQAATAVGKMRKHKGKNAKGTDHVDLGGGARIKTDAPAPVGAGEDEILKIVTKDTTGVPDGQVTSSRPPRPSSRTSVVEDAEALILASAQQTVYGRTYSVQEVAAMTSKERAEYKKKLPKVEKQIATLKKEFGKDYTSPPKQKKSWFGS